MNTRHLQRLQLNWDWRAAANFILGGMGAGLVAFTSLHAMHLPAAPALVALGLALVGGGLFCVWLEIGRPWRAFNVFFHLRRSWMSREALAAAVLFAIGAGLVLGMRWRAWPTALAALAFVYCQVRILSAARAIPAWRGPAAAALVFVTALAEGAGLFWVFAAWSLQARGLVVAFALLVFARAVAWEFWRVRMAADAGAAAAGWVRRLKPWARWPASALPLALALLAAAGVPGAPLLLAIAGGLAVVTGAAFKYLLVTRLAFHQGFALPRMPVRGVPRAAHR